MSKTIQPIFLQICQKVTRVQTISNARSTRSQVVKKFQEQARERSKLRLEALGQQEEIQKKKTSKKDKRKG